MTPAGPHPLLDPFVEDLIAYVIAHRTKGLQSAQPITDLDFELAAARVLAYATAPPAKRHRMDQYEYNVRDAFRAVDRLFGETTDTFRPELPHELRMCAAIDVVLEYMRESADA